MADVSIKIDLKFNGEKVVQTSLNTLNKQFSNVNKNVKNANNSIKGFKSNLSGIDKAGEKTSKTFKKTTNVFDGLKNNFENSTNILIGFKSVLLGLAAGFGLKKVIDEATNLENAMIGLTAVAKATGQDVGFITDQAKELSADGIIPLSDVSASLKNLLASGLDGKKAVEVFKSLRDAASFNRQGQLSMAEAVRGATDGIKNQNSIMVDNSGVTKNLSVIVKEYAVSVGKSVAQLSEQEKRLAIANGIIKESATFQGNYNLSLQTFTGAVSAASGNFRFLLADIGEMITKSPIVIKGIQKFTGILQDLRKWVNETKKTIRDFMDKGLDDLLDKFNFTNGVISTVSTGFILLAGTILTNIGVIIRALGKFVVSLGLVSKAMTALKAVATLGLAIALDVLIYKVLDLKDEMGGFEGLLLRIKNDFLTFFNFLRIQFEEAKIAAIGFVNEGLGAVVTGLNKVVSAFGTKIEFEGFDLGLQDSLNNIAKINEETDKLQQEITDTIKIATKKQAEAVATNLGKGYDDALKTAKDMLEENQPKVKVQLDKKAIEEEFKKSFTNPFEVILGKAFDAETLKKKFGELKISLESANLFSSLAGATAGLAKSLTGGGKAFLTTLIKGAGQVATAVLGPLGPIIGDTLSSIIETFGIDPEEFRKMIMDTFSELPTIIANTLINLAELTSGRLVADIVDGFIENIPYLVEKLTESIVINLSSPMFWTRVAIVATAAFIRNIPEMIQGFIDGFRNGVTSVIEPIEQAGDYLEQAGDAIKDAFNYIVDLIKSAFNILVELLRNAYNYIVYAAEEFFRYIIKGAANFVSEILKGAGKFVEEIINKIPGASAITGVAGGIVGTVSGAISSIGSALGFAEGGYVPKGFPNDTFPARLSSGEFVLDRSLASKLSSYLEGSGSGSAGSSNITDALLARVIDLLERPIDTSATVELDNREFANILLQMNRTNQRTAV